MKTRLLHTARLSFPLASAIAALLAPSLHAQTTRTWDTAGGSAWLTAANWSADTTPGAVGSSANTDVAQFTTVAISGNSLGINMNTGTYVYSLGAIDWKMTAGAAATIGNSSTTTGAAGTLRLNGASVNVGTTGGTIGNLLAGIGDTATQNLTIQNTAGTGTRTMGVQLGSTAGTIYATSGRTLTISSIISELATNSGFTKSGAGALTLSATNTYTGTTAISGGAVNLGTTGALGSSSAVTMAAGTIFSANAAAGSNTTISAPVSLSGTGNTSLRIGAGAGSNTTTFTLNGAISGATGNVVFTTGTNSFGNGTSLFVLGAANDYTGNTFITTGNGANNPVFVRNGIANALPATTVLSFDNTTVGGGTGRTFQYDLNGFNQTLAGLNNGGVVPSLRNMTVTSTNAATLTIDGSTDTTFGGRTTTTSTTRAQITGAIALTKNGSGTFTLGGTLTGGATAIGNTFTGDTTVLGGILVLGESASIQSSAFDTGSSIAGDATNGLRAGIISGTPVTTLTLGGLKGGNHFSSRFTTTSGGYAGLTALTLNPGTGASPSYSGDIGDGAGGMSLTKTGAGTQTLAAASSHTGATLVSAGTLALSSTGTINSSSGITLNGSNAKLLQNSGTAISPAITLTQGTLTGNGAVNTVDVGAGTGGIVSNNDGVAGASLTIGSLTFNGAATVNTFSSSSAAPIVTTSLASNAAGIVTINATLPSVTPGTYDLISFGGGSIGGAGSGQFAIGSVTGAGARQSKTLGISSTAITLTLGADDTPAWAGDGDGKWNVSSTNNWKLLSNDSYTLHIAGDNALFNDDATGAGPISVDIDLANVAPATTTFNNSTKNYVLSSSGGFGISSGSLTKSGSGSLTITSNNTYSGATTISGGILQLGDGGTSGGLSASSVITLASGATFVVNQSDTVTQGTDFSSADITGAGGFTQAGIGTTILNVANSYTGITAINGGTLQLGAGGTTGALTGTSGITSSGTATLAINRSNAFSQATDLNGQAITGTNLALTQAGTGTTTLSLANSYGGLTTINSGVLRITDAGALGSTSVGVVVNGNATGATTNARLELSGGIIVAGESATIRGNGNFFGALQSFSGSNEWAGNITVDADLTRIGAAAGASLLVSGVIDDGVNDYRLMYRVGDAAASVTLSGANTYTGQSAIVGAGPVIVGSLNSVVGGSASSHLGAPVTADNGRIVIGTTSVNGTLRYIGTGETTDRTIQIGDNASGTPLSTDTGSAAIENNGTTGALVFSAPTFNAPTNALTGTSPARTLTLGGSNPNANTISGIIQNNQIASSPTAAVNLTKIDAGSWTLGGANTYTGTTTIDNGTLAFSTVNQSLSGGLTFGAAVGSTNTGNLDLSGVSATFAGALTVRTENSTAAANTINIGSGQSLNIGNGMTVGFNSASNTVTKLNVTGAGALNITAGTFQLGGNTTTAVANAATLDMSGLSTFSYNVSGGTFRVGDATNSGGQGAAGSTLILADTSSVTAAFFTTNNPGGQTQTIKLGSVANTIHANSISIGAVTNRASGVMEFNESTGNLTIRDTAGTGRANLAVVYGASNTGVNPTGVVDLTGAGHSADLLLGTLQIAGRTATSGGGATGTFSFQNGTLDATSVAIAVRGARTVASGATTGTLNLGGGTVIIGTGGINVAENSSAAAGDTLVTGTINISGGTVSIDQTGGTSITLGTNTNAANGGTVANLNLSGGTTTLSGDIVRGTATGTITSTLTLNGGTLDMGGNDIGAGGSEIILTAQSGTLKNVASINGTGGLTKTTAGTLLVEGNNPYAGDTSVSEGTLTLAGAASPTNANANNDASTVTIAASGATLNLTYTGTDVVDELYIGGEQKAAGIWGGTGSGAPNTDARITGTGTLTVTTGPAGFSSWITGAFANGTVPGAKQGPNDDPDNDGIPNVVEYAIAGQDPTVSTPSIGTFTGTSLSFDKRQPLAADITYAIQESTDLGTSDTWAEVPSGPSYTQTSTTISCTWTPGTPTKNFFRLQITQNTP